MLLCWVRVEISPGSILLTFQYQWDSFHQITKALLLFLSFLLTLSDPWMLCHVD